MASLVEVRVPDIGDFKDVEIIEVAVAPGDTVALDATLITLETEKATMDVPSTVSGVVRELKVSRGGRVSQGDLIALVESAAEAPAATTVAVTASTPPAPTARAAAASAPPAAGAPALPVTAL